MTKHIGPLIFRVIELAVRDIEAWDKQGIAMNVAINLSARNFLDPALVPFLLDTCKAHGVHPKRLQLEITETVLMKDPEVAQRITHQLVDAGFSIALDDFGTGYSSLSYLSRFPINSVKIDRSFIANIIEDQRSKTIVEATIDLTHKLGYLVTAEGVEHSNIKAILKGMGCDQQQGYLYSKALDKAEFEAWYKAR